MRNPNWFSKKFLAGCVSAAVLGAAPMTMAGGKSGEKAGKMHGEKNVASMHSKKLSKDKVQSLIQGWPEVSKMAANNMLNKYGVPSDASSNHLVWYNNGPWKRTVVHSEEVQHNFPMPHKDVLEQVINLNVPADKFDELAKFDGSLVLERTRGELAVRCDKEAANFLAINLAKDIIDGKQNVDQARTAYADSIVKSMQNQKVAYMDGFQFDVPKDNINNPDVAVIDPSTIEEGERAPASAEEK